MLVTRPEPDASETGARLRALRIAAEICPLLTHQTLHTSLPDARGFAAMAVTSANALRALDERGVLADYRHIRLHAVGNRTAALARSLGFTDVQSAGGTLADLAELLAHAGLGGPIFYPAGRDLTADLAKSLAPYGVMVITTQVYAMSPLPALPETVVAGLGSGGIGAALFYSRRTAATFAALVRDRLDREVHTHLGMLCLSEAVAEPLIDAHFVRIGLADQPSEEAMMGLALSFSRGENAS